MIKQLFINILILLLMSLSITSSLSSLVSSKLGLGFDYGTSGVRCCLVNINGDILYENSILWKTLSDNSSPESLSSSPASSSIAWSKALRYLLNSIPSNYRNSIETICSSGTSSTVLMYDLKKKVVSRQPRMYDYNILKSSIDISQGNNVMKLIRSYCPDNSVTNAPTSTLAKLLLWHMEERILPTERLVHQADYIINDLATGTIDDIGNINDNIIFNSDWHNALKLGYDVHKLEYPSWLRNLLEKEGIDLDTCFPKVSEPGHRVGYISPQLASSLNIPSSCQLIAGTTDSIAAFLASGVDTVGQGVTSLGSTVAIKLLSDKPVEDSNRGIYSHRLGNRWLVGGASNVGCAILRQEGFTDDELKQLSEQINPLVDSPLNYYPLKTAGERFPINDPNKQPVLEPKPQDRKEYLHGILQGITNVELDGYKALADLGASRLVEVFTAGGGAKNNMWMKMRERYLGVPTKTSSNIDAAYGAALLAKRAL